MTDGLKGKRVVVTAGGDGIGKAVACAFHDAGARVHICDVVAERITALDGISGTLCDVGDAGQVDHLFDEAEAALGGLDILVNNAGISGPTAGVEDVTVEDWDRTIAVDLNGQFYCARRAVPLIKAAGGGSIVNLASTLGVQGAPRRAAYSASKHAVNGLTKQMALELGEKGIRVNAVGPGVIRTPMTERYFQDADYADNIRAIHALNRWGEPGEVAKAILFLASDDASFCTGTTLMVDGGWTAGKKF